MANRIKVNQEHLQAKIDQVSQDLTSVDAYAARLCMIKGPTRITKSLPSYGPNTIYGGSPLQTTQYTVFTDKTELFGAMESATITNLEKILLEVRKDLSEEVIDNMVIILSNIQTAKDTWVQTDEDIAQKIT